MRHISFWPTPGEVAQSLGGATSATLGVELAPSGRVHPGIVRTLMYATCVSDDLDRLGIPVRVLVRVNDLAAVKSDRATSAELGRPLIVDNPVGGAVDPVGQLAEDLRHCANLFQLRLDDLVLASSIYSDPAFRGLLVDSLARGDTIGATLARHQDQPVQLFWPMCPSCRLLYSSIVLRDRDGRDRLQRCRSCGYEGPFDVSAARGVAAFKLETALMWAHLGIDVDIHGQDHLDAYCVATEVSDQLFRRAPCYGRVNLTFDAFGDKVSKSKGNFVPVAELDTTHVERLRQLIQGTRWHRPVHLPESLSRNSAA